MTTTAPPPWAQAALALILKKRDQDTITGDLLEEYRQQSIDEDAARLWYIRQVAVFAWRWALPAAILLTVVAFGRFLLDVLVPPANFVPRSVATTFVTAVLYFVTSAYASWRSGRALSGPLLATCASLVHFALNGLVTAIFLTTWSDPAILRNIERSGGLVEHLTLPLFPVLPISLVLGTGGGILGSAARNDSDGGFHMKNLLMALCTFSLLSTAYLTLSVLILNPPRANLGSWFRFASLVAAQSIVTLFFVQDRFLSSLWRWILLPGAVAIGSFGVFGVVATLSHEHFEGYMLVLASSLVLQCVLTVPVLARQRPAKG